MHDDEQLIARLTRERDEAARDLGEAFALNERLSTLLTGVVDALRGKPEPNTAHSWHDLPEVAARVMADREALRNDLMVAGIKADHGALDTQRLLFSVGYLLGIIDRYTGPIDE